MIAIFLILAAILSIVSINVQAQESLGFGYGAQRLKNFKSKGGQIVKARNHQLQGSVNCENVTQHWFQDAVIDNFAPIEQQQKWYNKGQRYWLNKQFWAGVNYPIFVFIGGEGEESCGRLTNKMYLYQLAEKHRALLVNIEHRFYGQSIPTPDSSTKNLAYLSSQQALADLAKAIQFIKNSLGSEQSPVITVGGSYPGNLAAWFRLKYPSVTQGSIASSAPVLAKTNFFEYMEVVSQSIIHFSGQTCYNNIELAANIISNLALQGIGSPGMKKLETDFELCSPIKSDLDLTVLLSDLMGNFQGTVQYNNEHNGVMNVTDICKVMTQSDDAYSNFVALQKLYREANGQTCEDGNWDDTVKMLKETGASRSWTYQTCNEFGYYQTADSKNQPFYSWKWLNLAFSREICKAAFDGWKSDPQVEWINELYGNIGIAGTNIIFPSGTIDPWHALGVSNVTTPLPQQSEKKLYIEGTAHCSDLYAPASSDPSSLVFARQRVAAQVDEWLNKVTTPLTSSQSQPRLRTADYN